ncbi:unnamed protein product [Arctogadus glacialis]
MTNSNKRISSRARPPPPVTSPPEQLKGEAERLGTGGLWCQDGPETEAGDQGPAAPDQKTRNPWLKELVEELLEALHDQDSLRRLRRADGGAKTLEDDITPPTRILNVFLERRRADGGAVNLEDDHHSTNKDYKDSLRRLRRADGGARTLEDNITPPTRILTRNLED